MLKPMTSIIFACLDSIGRNRNQASITIALVNREMLLDENAALKARMVVVCQALLDCVEKTQYQVEPWQHPDCDPVERRLDINKVWAAVELAQAAIKEADDV